ncbi:MAG TPA: hypothetical protein VNZ48_02355 [Xanthobacteraceae bacterium]|jgi:hypothetical protein|nr:hypothetical protein [Xanthobacteraceae bacterium]
MTSLIRRLFCACVLILVAVGSHAGPALSQQTNESGPPVRLAMAVAPLNSEAMVPRLVEPAQLLCGKVWVNTAVTPYVLPNNCLKSCLHNGHSTADCKITLVPICEACWKMLLTCSTAGAIQWPYRCGTCTAYYAQCMKPFF